MRMFLKINIQYYFKKANYGVADGLHHIKQYSGLCIVKNPETTYSNDMPQSAIKRTDVKYILDFKEIISLIGQLK